MSTVAILTFLKAQSRGIKRAWHAYRSAQPKLIVQQVGITLGEGMVQPESPKSPGPIVLSKQNSPLEQYLQYYVGLEAPEFAVLVIGPWGAGKTHQVRTCLPPDRAYFISLYGVDSVDRLHAEVLAASSPTLSKWSDLIIQTGKAAGDAIGVGQLAKLAPQAMNIWLRRALRTDNVLVFDDLERSGIPHRDLLGAINYYVEHQKFRVIVIAHDEKLVEGFSQIKEKTFGQTLLVETQLSPTFVRFMSEIPNSEIRSFIQRHESEILLTFRESRVDSLRILRHVMEDLARLHPAFKSRHYERPEGIAYVVQLFVALNLEYRAGRLSKENLLDRSRTLSRVAVPDHPFDAAAERLANPVSEAANRYSRVRIADVLLNDEVLIAMLVGGTYNIDEIEKSLDASAVFTETTALRPWQVIINFDEVSDENLDEAISRMEVEFAERIVVDPGELLHIFSLRMMLAELGSIGRTVNEVADETIQYIDHLLESGRLEPKVPGAETRLRRRSFQGIAFWVNDTYQDDFERVHQHLNTARSQAYVDSHPRMADDFQSVLAADPARAIAMVKGEQGTNVAPFLALISPANFAAQWLALAPSWWQSMSHALTLRYADGRLEEYFGAEREWLLQLRLEMMELAEAKVGLAALRIRRAIPEFLKDLAAA